MRTFGLKCAGAARLLEPLLRAIAGGGTIRVVSALPRNENPDDAVPQTLGALLYADRSKVRIAEGEWVTLVRSIAAGDEAALQALFERTQRLVFTLVIRLTADVATAEELTLDVFHDIWRRASKYDPIDGTVLGWIMNQARSRAIDRLRYEHRKKRVSPELHDTTATTAGDSAVVAEASEQSRIVHAALAVLTPAERQAIELAFFSELTYAETAAALSQPVGTIKTRIRSGLEKLRHALQGGGRTP